MLLFYTSWEVYTKFGTVSNKTIRENLNLLRKFALGMIKQYKSKTTPKRAFSKLMFDCLLDPNMILRVLAQN